MKMGSKNLDWVPRARLEISWALEVIAKPPKLTFVTLGGLETPRRLGVTWRASKSLWSATRKSVKVGFHLRKGRNQIVESREGSSVTDPAQAWPSHLNGDVGNLKSCWTSDKQIFESPILISYLFLFITIVASLLLQLFDLSCCLLSGWFKAIYLLVLFIDIVWFK